MTIHNEYELRDAYDRKYFLELVPIRPDNEARVKAKLDELKREIREYNNRTTDRRCVSHDYDSFTVLIDVPAEVRTMEEAEEWFDMEERVEFVPREYDCTGQPFTSWHHIGILGGRMVCWHHVCYDI